MSMETNTKLVRVENFVAAILVQISQLPEPFRTAACIGFIAGAMISGFVLGRIL